VWLPSESQFVEVWSAQDALVLKAVAIVLSGQWHDVLSESCFHLAGRGGAQAAVREVTANLPEHQFVFRTDVKSYYASMDHHTLVEQLRVLIPDDHVLALVEQYICRTTDDGGVYEQIQRGMCLGCPLSPLMGAVYLHRLDERMKQTGLFYARFMDDWVILAPSRWKLRKAIALVNQTLTELKVEQHPDKTFIGRISRGFDFLGYRFTPAGLSVARQTVRRCVERVHRLYEQGADAVRIGGYVRRWCTWVMSGLSSSGDRLLRTVNEIRGRLTASKFPSNLPVRHRAEVLIQRVVDVLTQEMN
jgi:RNA-directed DNA polymerase